MELSPTNELQLRDANTAFRESAFRPTQRYEIISELGGGGMSTVHLAHDSASGRIVAVKRIAESVATVPDAMQRFVREASIAAQLQHPNIVGTVAIERDGATPTAIVTEYVRGSSLRDVLAETVAVPVERVVRVLRDVAAALAYAHARNIVHRDVKPANILIESDTGRALLADFGIACESGALPELADDGLTIGTPAYMAPEQIEGRPVDARADVYALCIVAWEMLAGRMPWSGAPLADVLHRQRFEPLPDIALLRPDIPVYLLHAINGGLAKNPARRWRDGAELLRQLSPTPTPIDVPRATSIPFDATMLDATMLVETRAVQEARRGEAADRVTGGAPLPGRRPPRARLLATTIGTVAVALALGGLAPHLSHASGPSRAVIDPELDSMLTLALVPHQPPTEGLVSRAACRAAVESARASECATKPRLTKGSRKRTRRR